MAKTIVTGNFKGGVGKTTNAIMLGYTLSRKGYKVLIVDLDPQANATETIFNTMQQVRGIEAIYKTTLFTAIKEGDLRPAVIHAFDNLDILPSYIDLQEYERYLYDTFDSDLEMDRNFNTLLDPLKADYDYILIDVPPQLNKFTDSALFTCDYVMIILQTHERSLRGSEKYIEHLLGLNETYGLSIELVGILPVLLQNRNKTDLEILLNATEQYGNENMFKTEINQLARLKRYDRTGITYDVDVHDKRVHYLYNRLAEELIERIDTLETL